MKISLDNERNKNRHIRESDQPTQEVDSLGNPLTQEQINYFRDSKVRDSRGRLLVCYHGTPNNFDEFDKSKIGSRFTFLLGGEYRPQYTLGFYFTDDRHYANTVGCDGLPNTVKECYLNLQNPLVIDVSGWGGSVAYADTCHNDLQRWSRGHDGIIINHYDEEDKTWLEDRVIIAFEPNQIKSITNTNPTNSDNINEDLTLYRVGDVGKGTFFTDDIKYYQYADSAFEKGKNAKAYTIDLSGAKVFDPMKDLGWEANCWSDILAPVDEMEKYDINYESEEGDTWGHTSTDDIAWAIQKLNNYDAVIFRDIRSDGGWGKPFNEYVIYNTDLLKPVGNINEELLSESLHRLDSDCFITDSPYTMRDILTNKPKAYRILYDANIDSYMFCDANDYIHWDLLTKAYNSGYYADIEKNSYVDPMVLEYIKDGSLNNYADLGSDGYYWDDNDDYVEFGQYLLYAIWIPKGTNEDDVANSPSSDGYDEALTFNGGTLHIRDSSQELMDNCDLIKLLQKQSWANESMELNEGVNNKDLLSFIYENLPLQKEMYWWSTFILPDGNFINLDKISEEYDSDEHQVLFDYLSDNGYNVTEADVVEGLGCIKLNIHYPYIGLSDSVRPTPAQCSTLKKWLRSAESEFGSYSYVKMANHSMTNPIAVFKQYTDKVYDLGVVSPDELVKTIQKSYSSGILEDKRNELKENMNDNDMNIHPQVAMQLDYLRRNAEDKYNKGSRREYENIYNYKEYQKEIDRDGDKNLLVKGKFKDPYEFRMFGVKPFARRYRGSDLLVHRPGTGGEILVHLEDIDIIDDVNDKLKESIDITNEVQREVDNVIKNKSKYKNQDDLESAIYSAVANCFSGMNGVTRTTSDMIDDVYEKELERVGLNTINEEFVNELVPGELYHFTHNNEILYGTFKRKTPAWLFFDVEGEEVLAKPWDSVATTAEELEELIGLVNKMKRDTKVPSQVPNRFTRVPNQHNKPLGEDYVEDLVVGKKYYFTNRGEVYHAKFKEKTPTWLIFVDDDGETIYTNHWVDISTSKKDLLDTPNNPYEKDSEDKKSKKDFEIDDKEVSEISDDDKKKEFKDKANAILSKVISGVKSCGGSIRNIDRNFDEDSFRLTIVCSVSEAKEDRFEDTIELSIKSNLRELISAKDLTISVFNKMASKDNNINYYISVEGKDWRSKLTEANELEQDVEMFYDRQLRLWTIYLKDEEGNQISNTEYAPNRKEALYIANNKGLFTMREDLNTPNQHNKSLDESNELKQRARKHSKKQKGMSPFISLDAGNVEKGIEVFNSSVADGSGMAMCEDMDKQTYHYEGPIYYNGHKEASKTDIYTRATSIRQAKNNIIYRISGGKDMYKFDIVDNQIEEVIDDNYEEIPHDPHNKCDICGNLLNNNNECPRCDYGEYDLDESIQVDSNLDAMAQLNRLD